MSNTLSAFFNVLKANIVPIKLQKLQSHFLYSVRRFSNVITTMADAKNEELIANFRKSVKEQGDLVRKLKEEHGLQQDIDLAVKELKARKKLLEAKILEFENPGKKFDRRKFEDLLKRRFFYAPAFEIYGGVSGLYDFGPMGCSMETNIVSTWRSHFILEEQLLEVRCTQLTPHQVLKASGHVDRFTDFMVRDVKTGDCYRADHLLEGHLEKLLTAKNVSADKKKEYEMVSAQVDNYSKEELWTKMQHYKVKAPSTNNDLTEPVAFNLMFGTSIGPSGLIPGYLRPETAQGIFLNFARLLDYNNGRLPFGGAQIGCGFRNEISPRAGLLRVREFLMGEIEYFVDPLNKSHPKFENVSSFVLPFYSRDIQMRGESPMKMSLGEAVKQGIVSNTTVAYFLGRIYSFLVKIGVDETKMRFRQHMANEMAHYACDCWDCELKTSYGWVECVGCADRACFDLHQHSVASGTKLVAQIDLDEPISEDVIEVVLDKSVVGKTYRKTAKVLMEKVAALCKEDVEKLENDLNTTGSHEITIGEEKFVLDKKMVQEVKRCKKDVHVRIVEPHVIEPSFGIGRILYSVLEHNFQVREDDEQRTWLSLPPSIAPVKCSILPLSKNTDFDVYIKQLSTALTGLSISHKVDDSGVSIGRRYARNDEISIPFGITIDFDTVQGEDSSVTLRERNSTLQVRIKVDDVPTVVNDLTLGKITWQSVVDRFGLFQGQENTK